MSLTSVKLCVEYAYSMPSKSFKRALLVAIVHGHTFAHPSEFQRWLAFRIESFGEADFVCDAIPYHECSGGLTRNV